MPVSGWSNYRMAGHTLATPQGEVARSSADTYAAYGRPAM
jgi:hypothetical protein